MLLLLTALALSQNPAPFTVQGLRLAPHFETVAPALVMVPRDHWLDLVVTLTAPSVESDVESFEVEAENQSPGYWVHRHGPNIFVKAERLESTGERYEARTRVVSSGSGKSLREHEISIQIEFLESPDERKARIRSYFERILRSQDPSRIDAATAYFDQWYIANPPGKYEVTITYKPQSGIFAGQLLGQRLSVVVNDGPDTLDGMFRAK